MAMIDSELLDLNLLFYRFFMFFNARDNQGVLVKILVSRAVETSPGGLWEEFPPSSTPNGCCGAELCPKTLNVDGD